jgi:hypothetical protein
MIPEVAFYQGVALREIILAAGGPTVLRLADVRGRVDCFGVGDAIILIKYSTKRLSPWQFSVTAEQYAELMGLADSGVPVWLVLVCGTDGVLELNRLEVDGLIGGAKGNTSSIRVSRSRNTQYRLAGSNGRLSYTKPRGVSDLAVSLRNRGAVGGEES